MSPTAHNDEPSLLDCLGREALVRQVGDAIAGCNPPYVFGIHGDWGAGKTSFLHQLQLYLSGACSQQSPDDIARIRTANPNLVGRYTKDLTVVWFEAWRYQHESVPIVALLQEIRTQLPWSAQATTAAKKYGEVVVRGALLAFEDLTKKIGIQASKIQDVGERWERDNLAVTLPSHMIRQHLEVTLRQILGSSRDGHNRRLIVLVDDLDRCESEAAYKLLEGIKIYLNLPSCVFVLGMNQAIIEQAISQHIGGKKEQAEPDLRSLWAREYLEKLCNDIWHLPIVRDSAALVERSISASLVSAQIAEVLRQYRCLPANPRKIKAFATVLQRFVDYHAYTRPLTATADDLRHRRMLVLMASLYHFHPGLYRVIEGSPKFYELIRDWAQGKTVDHEALKDLRAPAQALATKGLGGTEPTPIPSLVETYPDPVRGNVFRVQALMNDLGPIPVTELERYLLG